MATKNKPSKDTLNHDGAKLSAHIERLGISIPDFAKKHGLTRQGIYYYIRTERLSQVVKDMLASKGVDAFGGPEGLAIPFYESDGQAPALQVLLPDFADCNTAIRYRGQEIGQLRSGDWLICRSLDADAQVVWGELYRLRTADYTVVRRIHRGSDPAFYRLVFEGMEDIEVRTSSILSLYHVRGKLGFL